MASDGEYDIVIAGGGAAGGVIAGRLAAADPSLRILLLEAGPHTKDQLFTVQPARYFAHLLPTSTTTRFYVANPSPHLDGRSAIVPVGACLGGGSSINFMMYTRASASDYDDWERAGNPGWGAADLVPFLKKVETYQVAEGQATHGYDGPLKVSYGGAFTNMGKDFLEVAGQYDKDRRIVEDPNNIYEIDGYGRWAKWISADKGTRSDVAHHFLYNQAHNTNLVIETGAQVRRVLFEGSRAVGVEYTYSPRVRPNDDTKILRTARAARLVVVCAGAFGSPLLLERSGIGRKDVLEKIGVEQIVELPGVGENYQDHQVMFVPYIASEDSDTIDGIVRSDPAELHKWEANWVDDGQGLMSTNAIDAAGKLRPTSVELDNIGPAFKERWAQFFDTKEHTDKPAYLMGVVSMFVGDPTTSPYRKYYSMGYLLMHPTSVGYVHATSADDVDAAPDFDPAYCSTADDVELLTHVYKRSREFARRMRCFRGEYGPAHPAFAEDSTARVLADAQPVPMDAEDVPYTEADEEAIRAYTRATVGTCWHSLGTCAMKPREKGGVVDPQLNVYGTENLKVADMSIAPGNVGANTYSTALTIGEKAALIIAEMLGIQGV